MIRRNTASQNIVIGPLLLLTDGTAATTGASIYVSKDGVDQGAGAGTLTHWRSGVWSYAPTQGETDCAVLGLSLEKTSYGPVPLTVLTTYFPVQTSGVLPTVAAGASGGLLVTGAGANAGGLTINGGVTFANSAGDGLTCSSSGSNGKGWVASGNGSGAGMSITGGATGNGWNVTGGGTSGDGVFVSTTVGHGIRTSAQGSSKHGAYFDAGSAGGHGLFVQAEDSGDGLRAASGTGVPIRGNMTANITGNLSGSVGSVTAAVTLPTIPADWITAAGIATDAIGSSELAASAVTEIQSGLSTHSAADVWSVGTRTLTAIDEDTTALDLDATVRAAISTELARIDVATSTRLASASYTAPDNAGISTAAGAAVSAAADTQTLLARVGVFAGSGLNTVLGFFRALLRKTAALTPSDVGGTYDNTSDSLEAQKDSPASVPTAAENADKLLGRTRAGGADGGRTVAECLAPARNRIALDVPASGQFTVYADDDSTPLWVGSYTRGSNALGPLTGTDPS